MRVKKMCAWRRNMTLLIGLGVLLCLSENALAQSRNPSSKDKCPVCGMFVSEYRNFLAEIVFKDGFHAYFDGSKDMFRYYFEPEKYHPARKRADIAFVYVTEYYSLNIIDGFQSFYVIGSDVRGPMGNELIPIAKESDAQIFMNDHKGKSILKFDEITLKVVNGLD